MEAKIQLFQETCCREGCHVAFFLEEKHQARLMSNKTTFYCPNGHPQHYTGESDEAKILRLIREKNAIAIQKNTEIEQLKRDFKNKSRKKKVKIK